MSALDLVELAAKVAIAEEPELIALGEMIFAALKARSTPAADSTAIAAGEKAADVAADVAIAAKFPKP